MKLVPVKYAGLKFVGLIVANSSIIGGMMSIFLIYPPVNAQEFRNVYLTDNSTVLEPNQAPAASKTPLSGKFTILPLGINVGGNNVIPSVTVKGLENGKEAIDFNHWLVPFADVIKALKFNVTKKDDGQLELRSVGLIIKFDSNILINDPDIGQAISVEQIRNILKIPAEFSIAEYALVLTPSWLTKSLNDRRYQEKEQPVILAGLPQINPPFLSLTGISQRTNLSQTQGTNFSNNNLNYNSEFKTLGSVVGGSLFSRIQQLNSNVGSNWQINELQYFHPSPYTDYIIGTQAPFWGRFDRNQSEYFGATIIQRLGYTPANNPSFSYGGVNPLEKLNTNQVLRTIAGKAAPGTLVQLVTQNGNVIVGEQLVDNSAKYRFENVVTASNSFTGNAESQNYKLLLYPGGNLSGKPEEIPLNYRNLQGQINKGKSAFVISAGTQRNPTNQSFFGNLGDFQGGATYYFGLTDEITLGTGVVYDGSTKPYSEILYQPVNSPLTFKVGALTGNQISFNADISYRTNNFSLGFGGDEKSYNSNLYWALSRKISLFSNWYSGGTNNRLETGFN
ncbi:MAG: carboxypeptidase regulatory-like domain-containing protein, partial [Dolichospermum sp.]|nr:carboxypeptidase regulatory-like domain-containing protein [Dolichospermum sp.]